MEKFYIIGTRYNPQLGTYLCKVKVATAKINKTCITAKFEEYGEMTSLKFEKEPYNGVHACKSKSKCVYGSFQHYGYSDKYCRHCRICFPTRYADMVLRQTNSTRSVASDIQLEVFPSRSTNNDCMYCTDSMGIIDALGG
jgi:hypothetical protein